MVENWSSGSGEEDKNIKVYDNNDDDGQHTNFNQKSYFEPSAQVSDVAHGPLVL